MIAPAEFGRAVMTGTWSRWQQFAISRQWLQACVFGLLLIGLLGCSSRGQPSGKPEVAVSTSHALEGATPAFVQVKREAPDSPQSVLSATFTAAQTAGNLNVVAVGMNDTLARVSGVTDAAGNVYKLAVGPTLNAEFGFQSIYYAKSIVAAAAGTNTVTVTFTRSGAYPDLRIAEYSGIDPVDPIDVVVGSSGFDWMSSSGEVDTRNAADLLVGAGYYWDAPHSPAPDYTWRLSEQDDALLEDRVVESLGSYGVTGQGPWSNWVLQLVAFRAAGSGPSLPDTIAPSPPANLALTTASDSRIDLSWDPAADNVGATHYIIERCTDAGCLEIAEVTGTTFSDTGLVTITNYRYRVRASDAAGNEGGYSESASGTAYTVPAFVQVKHEAPESPQSVLSATFTEAQTAGNLNVVAVAVHDTLARVSSVTDAAGNEYKLVVGPTIKDGFGWQSIYYAKNIVAAAADTNTVTVTFTRAGEYPDVRIAEYSGIDPVNPVDVVVGTSGFDWMSSSGEVMTRNAGDLLVGAGYYWDAPDRPDPEYTSRLTDQDDSILADRVVQSLGSYGISGQGPWTDWVLQLVAFRAAGSGVSLPDALPPSAPTNLAVTTVSDSQIDLSWDPAADNVGATHYVVERCTDAGCLEVAEVTGTTFSDTGLVTLTNYRYRVRASDAAGNGGDYSESTSATAYTVPAFVQVNSEAPESPQSVVSATFTEAQTAGNLNVVAVAMSNTLARVSSVTDAAGNEYKLAVGPTVFDGLRWQSIYYAKNIVAASAGSNTVTVTFTRPGEYPDVRIAEYSGIDPVDPIDAVVGATGVGWESDSGEVMTRNAGDLLVGANYAHPSATTYGPGPDYISRLIDPDGAILEDRNVQSVGSYSASSPREWSEWVMQLVAFRAAGSGPSLPDTLAPSAPKYLALTTVSDSQIDLSWDAAADNVGATHYVIERCTDAGCLEIADVTGTKFSDTGLVTITNYSYRVRARDAAGNGSDFSESETGTAYTVPAFVQVNSASPESPESTVSVAFAAAQTHGNLNVVVVALSDTSARVSRVVDSAGNEYKLAVGPTVMAGFGWQSIYYAKNIVAAAAGSNTVTVTFTRAGAYPDVRIVEYSGIDPVDPIDVVVGDTGGGWESNSGEITTRNAGDLLLGASYGRPWSPSDGPGPDYISRLIDEDGAILEDRHVQRLGSYSASSPRQWSEWVMQLVAFRAAGSGPSLPDTIAPSAPTNLSVTTVSDSQIDLSWDPAADNVGATRYVIERCTDAGCVEIAEVTGTTFSDTGLVTITNYSYRVRASDAAGNGSDFSETTSGAAYTVPAFVQVNSASTESESPEGSLSVAFSAAQTAGNLNVVAVGLGDTSARVSSVTDTAGNEYKLAVGPTLNEWLGSQSVYYAANIAPASAGSNTITVTFTRPALDSDVRIAEYSGIDPVDPIDVVVGAPGAGWDTSSGEVTTRNAGDLLVGAGFTHPWSPSNGPGPDYSSRLIDQGGAILEDRNVQQVGSYSASTTTNWGDWVTQLVAFRAAGSGASMPDTIAPNPPKYLALTTVSDSQIDLSWDPAADNVGATRYVIERCTDAGCLEIAEVTGTTFSDSGLVTLTNYGYRVRAIDAAGNGGGFSESASAAAYTVPAFVQANAASSASESPESTLSVAFSAAQTAGNLNVVAVGMSDTLARVSSVTDSAGNAYKLAVGPTSNEWLGSQSIYYAANIAPASAGSNTVTVTFTRPVSSPDVRIAEYSGIDPVDPIDVVVGSPGAGWDGNSGEVTTRNPGDLLLGAGFTHAWSPSIGAGPDYVSRLIDDDGAILEDRNVQSVGSYSASVPMSWGDWVVQLVAFRAAGSGASLPDTIAPSPPQSLALTTLSVAQIDLSWDPAADNVRATRYVIERCAEADCHEIAEVTGTRFSDSGLVTGTHYRYRVRAIDAAGNQGGYSESASGTTYTVPAFVQANSASPQSPESTLSATFTAAQTAGNLNLVAVGVSGTSARVSSVTDSAGNVYKLAVGPTANQWLGSQSVYYAANILAAAAGANTVTVTFSHPGEDPDVRIAEYSGIDAVDPIDVVVGSPGFGWEGRSDEVLTRNAGDLLVGVNYTHPWWPTEGPGSDYTSRLIDEGGCILEDRMVQSLGSYGASASMPGWSDWVMQMVAFRAAGSDSSLPDTTPPSTPTGLVVTTVSETQIGLSWDPVRDNVGATRYVIERCTDAGCVQLAEVTGTTYSDTGLIEGTNYRYRVRASDAAGNQSDDSEFVSGTAHLVPETPAFVQVNSACSTDTQVSVGVVYNDAQTAGNLNVVAVGIEDTSTRVSSVTDSAGNVYELAVGPMVAAGFASQSIYYAKNIATASAGSNTVTVTFTRAAAYPDVRVAEYSGIDRVDPIDVVASATGNGTVSSTGDVATRNPYDLLVGANLVQTHTVAPGTDYDSRTVTSHGNVLEDRLVSTLGSYGASAALHPGGWATQMPALAQFLTQANSACPESAQTTLKAVYEGAQTAGNSNFVAIGWNDTLAHITSVSDTSGNVYQLAVGPTALAGHGTQALYVASSIAAAAAKANQVSVLFDRAAAYPDLRIVETSSEDIPDDLFDGASYALTPSEGSDTDYTSRLTTQDGSVLEERFASATGSCTPMVPARTGDWVMQMVAFRAAGSRASSPDTTPPQAPTNLLATTVSATQIDLSWSTATDNVRATSYQIQRCLGPSCLDFADIATSTSTTFSDSGLISDAGYRYRVRATDAAGNWSGYSEIASGTAHFVPTTPAFVQVANAAPHVPATEDVGIDFGEEQLAGDLNVVAVGWLGAARVTSVTDTSGNEYRLAVGPTVAPGFGTQAIYYARNIFAAAERSNTVTVTFDQPAGYPDLRIAEYSGIDPVDPIDVVASATGNSALSNSGDVALRNAYDLLVGANFVAYDTLSAGDGFSSRVISQDGNALEDRLTSSLGSYSATAPNTAGTWLMQLVAFRSAGSPPSLPDTIPPSAPTAFLASTASGTQVTLTWTAASDNVAVTSYLLERCAGVDCSNFAAITTVTTGETYTDVGLTPGTHVSYRARANDTAGNSSAYSSVSSVTTIVADCTAPAPDTNCNGVDDDCDGQVDEDYVPHATSCGVGACVATGTSLCSSGAELNGCVPKTRSFTTDATCDGIDEDCDGLTDEEFAPLPTSCGVGACVRLGSTVCSGGNVTNTCLPGAPLPSDATCNGVDDNCNGLTDEGYSPHPTQCGIGACAASGNSVCTNGVETNACSPLTPALADSTCNGVDDDCDGQLDEDFASHASTCGVGACAAAGRVTCLAGALHDSCTQGTPLASDAICNGIDDDCNGQIDEDFVSSPSSCGVGACAASGQRECHAGSIVDSCSPKTGQPSDSSCNGVDDDCDGQIDEDYPTTSTTCGVGACAATGSRQCHSGTVSDSCTAGTAAAHDATCNGVDEDCDGLVDEEYQGTATTCAQGACQATGVTTCVNGAVSDSCHPGSAGSSDQTCDGVDGDCDGQIDEDYQAHATECGVGACHASGQSSCLAGVEQSGCSPKSPLAATDISCNGVDDDCDGQTDEEFSAAPAHCGVGACATQSNPTCVNGAVVDHCTPLPAAANDSTCNGVDDDCDGQIDEDYQPVASSCGVGACQATGTTACHAGQVETVCQPGTPAASDATCNGVDDDCDGQVDENFVSTAVSCGIGACVAQGSTSCSAGHVVETCTPLAAAASDNVCNGIDDDCNGQVDEDYQGVPVSCGAGVCAATGTTQCQAGLVQNQCTPGTPAANDATCDGLDNDCDGSIDEDFIGLPSHCGVGACAATGSQSCVSGSIVSNCQAKTPAASDAACNGIDDDCNGQVDEDYVSTPTTCGSSSCSGTGSTSCVSGSVVDSCSVTTSGGGDATCNGIDDDCDGQIDEDFVGQQVSCGVGACAAVGTSTCAGGHLGSTCTPGTASADDTTCNGIDDDCDGSVDEGFVATPTACGVGACHAVGTTECVAGGVVDSCVGGHPAANDATCNGIDDDCDGTLDEDYAPIASTCGVGACAKSGTKTCQAGAVVDSCQASAPAANDALCNGIDDDCDGSTDEEYAAHASQCGTGACGASGEVTCSAGHEVDSCSALQPAASDASCNGVDDDCNGAVDEDYVVVSTNCGVGACVAQGSTSCSAGHTNDSCQPGTPAANDTSCNGIDDNCNGTVDEGYVSLATTCGVGACKATGSTSCSSGAVTDSCSAHPAASSDATCDGIDDDCDGSTDENFVAATTSCGIGACSATGTTSCNAGQLSNSCHAGTGAAQDTTCNGIDDDCDGNTDEDFAGSVTHCGVGACAAQGSTVCINAQVSNNCHAGTPAASDATCDGIDDDCDGIADENFGVTCSGASVQRCVSGATQTVACDDGNSCNGSESCAAGTCKAGTPPSIDDGNVCTADLCQSGGITHPPLARGVPCAPSKACDGAGSCLGLPVITAQPTNLSVAPGQPIALSVTVTGEGLSYQWRRTGQNIPGATAATFSQTASQADDGAEFTVVVSNAAGSVVSARALISVQDSAGPLLTVNGPTTLTVSSPILTITGAASDAGSGVSLVAITSDRYQQALAAVVTPSTGAFSAEVPLFAGVNTLTVRARDNQANEALSTLIVTLKLPSLPQLAISAPISGSTTNSESIAVRGLVLSSLDPNLIRLTLNGDVRFPTGTGGEYQFEFPSVHLLPGQNVLTVRAETPEGAVTTQSIVTLGSSPGATTAGGPVIRVTGAQSALYTSSSNVTVAGTVSAQNCVETVTVNDLPATVTGAGAEVSFQTSLALPAGDNGVPVTVKARDCANRESSLQYTIYHDDVAPLISSALSAAPAVHSVTSTPYQVTASITEKNLAGVSANDQSLGVLPAADGKWDLNFSFPLTHDTDNIAEIQAWDRAGNRSTYRLLLRLEGGLEISVVSPSSGAEFQSLDATIPVQVVARVPGLALDQGVVAIIDGGAPAVLNRADSTFSGAVDVSAATGQHQLTLQARGAQGQILAETSLPFSTKNANEIPVSATLQEPLNGAANREANQIIQIAFNRPIDASQITVEVTETVHGKGYADLPSGSGLAQFTNLQLVDLNRDAAKVNGGVSYIPGDRLIAFYPAHDYGYGGKVNVLVRNGQTEVLRAQFGVRSLPTLISGFIADQFFQPVAGAQVQLDGAQISTVTNSDGVFSFGFGDFSQAISGGRHLLIVNPDLSDRRYGTLRTFVYTQEGRHRDLGVVRMPLLTDEPFRHITSGSASASLMDGALVYNLSGTEVVFPNGQHEGDVHVQVMPGSSIGYAAQVGIIPFFSYAIQPMGVEVAGPISVDFVLPPEEGGRTYIKAMPDRVLLSGLDPATLQLAPVGVGVIDRVTHRVHSEGKLELRRLDFLTITPLPSPAMQALFTAYGAGTVTLTDLANALAAAQ